MRRKIFINSQEYTIEGDEVYLSRVNEHFEQPTIDFFRTFCRNHFHALDLGANIGLTTIALANICEKGKIIAIEPIPHTFNLLKKNLFHAGITNVEEYNFAIGNKEGSSIMQGFHSFLAGSFIADVYPLSTQEFTVEVPVKTLDNVFDSFKMDRLDFIKIDIEGYELFALEGAKNILKKFKPIVYLEMNHWCLNVFQRITLPEFRERLLSIFPCIFAIEDYAFLDFSCNNNFHIIAHEHLIKFKYLNLVAGFNEEGLLKNLHNFSKLKQQIA